MKKLLILLTVLVSAVTYANDKEATLLTIGNRTITVGEFEYLYKKNNQVSSSDQNSIKDYIDLFVNFKLKVIEAEELGMDTIPTFVNELSGYEAQLAEPYLKDQDLDDKLIKEAYDRLKEEVEASHILIKIDSKTPADTLEAYNKIMKIRQEILDGKDFKEAAKAYSEDPSAATNSGYLGYFTGFQMVLPFEEAAFNTSVGEISQPTRSDFGYHILQVHNRRPSSGEVKVSHILIMSNDKMSNDVRDSKKNQAFELYNEIVAGKSFDKIAKEYSDDKGSAEKGGDIGFIKRGQTIPPFEDAAFNLKNKGDITPPIETRFGWHIIRLDEKRGIASYEDKKADIKRRLARDERGNKPEEVFLARLKDEYNFILNNKNIAALYAEVDGQKLDSALITKLSKMDATIMSFGDITFTQADYAQYCVDKKISGTKFDAQWKEFEKESLIDYEKTQLTRKYSDYKYLTNEYHDGLLLFEISNNEVWSKASSDTLGLEKFYKKNKKKYRFDEATCEGKIISIKDEATLTKYEALKLTMSDKAIIDSLTSEMIQIETAYYKKGENAHIDAYIFGADKEENEDYHTVLVEGVLYEADDIKPLKATRGACISDYQEYLEAAWVKKLRKKYKVKNLNKDLLAEIE